jgi:hypothetical protein
MTMKMDKIITTTNVCGTGLQRRFRTKNTGTRESCYKVIVNEVRTNDLVTFEDIADTIRKT